MGLMKDGDKIAILSDIADAEDFAGDMDFKVTGTEKGVTAMQMDMKVHGLPVEVLRTDAAVNVRLSQLAVEVLRPNAAAGTTRRGSLFVIT